MKEYKTKIGFIWYLIILAPVIAYFLGYPNSDFTKLCLFAFGIRLLIYYLYKKYTKRKIEEINTKLANLKNIKQLEEVVHFAVNSRKSLRMYLFEIIERKMDSKKVAPHQINEIIANNRPCYYSTSFSLVKGKRKKEDNSIELDISNEEKATLYIFNNNVEWVQPGTHRAIPVKNIIRIETQYDGDIVELTRRNEGIPIYFHTPNALIIKKIIEQIQKG